MEIANSQIKVLRTRAADNFNQRLSAHLREFYSTSTVRLPEVAATVAELPDERLFILVQSGIRKAQTFGLKTESSIAAYCALMFDVSPNFDRHPIARVFLSNEMVSIDKRFNKLAKTLTEEDWNIIREDYDINLWNLKA